MALAKAGAGTVIQIWSYPNPQGFLYRCRNSGDREMVDVEGLALVRRKLRSKAPSLAQAATPDEPEAL